MIIKTCPNCGLPDDLKQMTKSSLLKIYIKPTNTTGDKAINIRCQRWLLALLPVANKTIKLKKS